MSALETNTTRAPRGTSGHLGTPPVRVLHLRLLDGSGNLRAFADIQAGSLKIYNCRVVQQPGQRPWVAPPQREYMVDGQKRYAPIVEWNRELGTLITDAVIEAFERERDVEVPF